MEEDDSKEHFNLKKILKEEKKKGKKKRKNDNEETEEGEGTFQVDVTDSRFSALYDTPAFNIDPSAQEFKKTEAINAIIKEKIRRRKQEEALPPGAKKSKKNNNAEKTVVYRDTSLDSLVKSVKAKTQSLKHKNKR